MASQRQLDANRRNAQLSTGPNTAEGKVIVSRNALQHGLFARDAVLPEEDGESFLELLHSLETELQPADSIEQFLVQQMAIAQWRLERLTRIDIARLAHGEASCFSDYRGAATLAKQARHGGSVHRAFYKALEELESRQDRRVHPESEKIRNKPNPISEH